MATDPTQQLTRNGLVMETDLHRCSEGQLMVYNIFVDGDKNARTIENVEIPAFKKQTRSILGSLPTPGKLKSERKQLKQLMVTSLSNLPGIRVVMVDAVARYKLNIGLVDENKEEAEFSVFSYLSTIELAYYPSIITPDENVKRWLQEFVNIIERLPTNYLGNYLSGLRYIQGVCTIEPDERDLRILEMMLSSSEMTLHVKKDFDPGDFISDKGGSEFESKTLTNLFKLLSIIEKGQGLTLSTLAISYDVDMLLLCNQLLILESRDHIEIKKPEELNLEELFALDV